jgi:sulfur dioxygenase
MQPQKPEMVYKVGFIHHVDGEHLPFQETAITTSEIGMRQVFDNESCTYTYLLWDKDTNNAILVNPVNTCMTCDLLVATNFNLVYAFNTYCHVDHISVTGVLK